MPVGITVKGVSKKLGDNEALRSVDINFTDGQLHGLVGSEGAGKTTLLRILIRLLIQDSGTVQYLCDGGEISFKELRDSISYMPGRQNLYPDLSIVEHLHFFRELYGIPMDEYIQMEKKLLDITRLERFRDRRAGQLSGGMYKKLGLMCALLQRPKVLLLDEPTNGVDPISRREFWELLYGLAKDRILIIIATAYMDEAERCHEVHLLDAGRVIATGEPRKLLHQADVSSFNEFYLKIEAESAGVQK